MNEILIKNGLLLKIGTAVEATLIAAPSTTKNKNRERDSEMHSRKKGELLFFEMKALQGLPAMSMVVAC